MNRNIVIGIVVLVVLLGVVFVMNSQNSQQTQQPAGQSQTTETQNTTPTTVASPTESASSSGDTTEKGSVKTFTIESNGLSFTPNKLTVKAGDTVKITYKNNMGKHDLVIDEFNVKTQLLDAGQQETVEFVADKKGSYQFYCAVPGHRQSGMVGTLTVE